MNGRNQYCPKKRGDDVTCDAIVHRKNHIGMTLSFFGLKRDYLRE